MKQIRIGTVLYGYCRGYFGRDSYNDKRVEGVGVDWVVAREDINGNVVVAFVDPDDLLPFTTPPPEDL